jgi:hypothetical protein
MLTDFIADAEDAEDKAIINQQSSINNKESSMINNEGRRK